MEINVKVRKVQKIIEERFWQCTKCSREIVGVTIDQVKYNAKLHLDKHKKEDEEPRYTY